MKKIFLLVLCCCILQSTFAQYYTNQNKIWAFGTNVGLNFTSGTPVPFTSSISTIEGCASVCDAAGNLLFYTDGRAVYNRLGLTMPSGASIVSFVVATTTQGAVIVPFANDSTKYYVFSLEGGTGLGRLAHSIIDMTLDGGLGDISPGSAGITFNTDVGEKMMAVPGDACNTWLIVHRKDTPQFRAFNINSSGIISAPVISNVGLTGTAAGYYMVGTMKCSHDRQKIACANNGQGLELYDFNPSTGIVSNCRVLESLAGFWYGVEFSPDNSKLYATVGDVCQWDITLPSTAAIVASKTLIATWGSMARDLKLGPDSRIYVCRPNESYLDCISSPNAAGAGCGYISGAVNVSPNIVRFGLPNVVRSALLPTVSGASPVCEGASITLSAALPGGVWASSNPAVATVSATGVVSGIAPGTALILYSLASGCEGSETITVVATPTLSGASVCAGSSTVLTAIPGGGTWTSGSPSIAAIGFTSGVVNGIAGGVATMTYTADGCTNTTSVTVTAIAISGSGSAVCPGSTITLSSTTPGGTWSSGGTSTATIGASSGVVTGIAAGTVVVTYSASGCSNTTIVTVNPITPPGYVSLCAGATDTLTGSTVGGTWSSSNTAIATVGLASGIVTAITTGTAIISYVNSGQCLETFNLSVNPLPAAIVGPTTVAIGASITLTNATTGGTWSSSDITKATVNSTGKVTGVALGTTTVYYTLPTGCKISVVINVLKSTSVISMPVVAKPTLYPNPTTNEITIQVKQTAFNSFSIYNAVGQLLAKHEINASEVKVDVKAYPPGEYKVIFTGIDAREMVGFTKW